ncbi:hypothetical protein Tco_0895277 [Tanacetum coccineum]|uniref:GAG-pre-integrase domain-containing protein n=1 Tax=Tanacetum coccineum TaxID=301880 RepID=A0ABQ5CEJ4_9ASTR
MSWNNDSVNVEMQTCDSCEKCLNLDAELSKSKQAYNDLLKNYSQLEKIIFLSKSQSQLQDKDKTIYKLKATIKSLRENTKEENVNPDKCDLEPINKELENSEAKLLSENERKEIIENVVHTPFATTIASGMFKLDLEPFPPSELDFACKYATRIQELLVYVQDTCPNMIIPIAKKVTVKPIKNVKKVRVDRIEVRGTMHGVEVQLVMGEHRGDYQLGNLAKDGLARGIPRLKFQKNHLCSSCALGKSIKSSHKPKAKNTNQEKLYLLHMDLYGPMRVTLCEWYENVGITHQTSVARTPQQNGVMMQQGQLPNMVSIWFNVKGCVVVGFLYLEIDVVYVEFGCHFDVELELSGFGIGVGEFTLSSLDVLQEFSFFLQMGFTLIVATLDGLDVSLLGDVIGEDDYDDDG